ncbi:MAG: hypothetical protein U5L72_05950 [Bacteroidales bacterium]|nr:hypothetical protein [Bacteroidales bacterium]
MKFLQQNWLILTIVALVVAMVLIRSLSRNSFRYDAVRWAASSADGSNLIDMNQTDWVDREPGPDDQSRRTMTKIPVQFMDRTVIIQPESILERENIKLIRKNKGPVILFSGDASVSARIWMVLSEMGIKNLFVFTGQGPDTP